MVHLFDMLQQTVSFLFVKHKDDEDKKIDKIYEHQVV